LPASGIGDFQQHSETASYTLKQDEYDAPMRCTLASKESTTMRSNCFPICQAFRCRGNRGYVEANFKSIALSKE
jgi:hypothetical protein